MKDSIELLQHAVEAGGGIWEGIQIPLDPVYTSNTVLFLSPKGKRHSLPVEDCNPTTVREIIESEFGTQTIKIPRERLVHLADSLSQLLGDVNVILGENTR